MRHLFITLLCAIATQPVLAQYPATSERVYFTKSKTEWVEVTDFTDGITNDSIFGYIVNSKKFQRLDLNTTSFNAQSVGVKADGTDMSARLNTLFANARIKEVIIDQQNGGDIMISGNVNLQGKTLRFAGFTKLKRLSGSPVVSGGVIVAPSTSQIADTLISFSGIKTGDGNFYPQWLGAKADGVTDDVRYWQYAGDIAAQNRLKLTLPSGTHYANGVFLFKQNGTFVSESGAKIRAGTELRFRYSARTDSVMVAGNTIYVDSGSAGNDLFRLGVDDTLSRCLVFKNNTISGNRTSGTAISVYFVDNAMISHNRIETTNNKGIELRGVQNSDVSFNDVRNSGRSGICAHSNTNNTKIHHNTVIGSAQYQNFNDGAFDVYGGNNYNLFIENNYAETGNVSLGNNQNHILYRIQGAYNLQFNNNIAVSTSPYLLYAMRFSSRDSAFTDKVSASGNVIWIKKGSYYNRLVSVQDVKSLSFNNYKVYIDSGTTSYSSPTLFNISDGIFVDTVQHLNFTQGEVWANGLPFRMLGYDVPIRDIDFSGTDVYGMTQTWYTSSVLEQIGSVRWIGGDIQSDLSASVFTINNNIRSAVMSGLNVKKQNDKLWTLEPGYSGTAIFTNNIINGRRAGESGGGSYTTSATITDTSFNVPDSAGVVYAARTSGNQAATLPSAAAWKNRRVDIVGLSGTIYYTVVTPVASGKDTVRNGEVGSYHSDGASWREINSSGATGGGSGVSDGNKVDLTVSGNNWIVNTNAITFAKIQQAAGLSVLGRDANSTGNVAAIAAATAGHILYRNGTSLEFGKPDLVAGISTALSGYLKAAGSSFTAAAKVPYSDLSGVPDVFVKNSSNSGDTILYTVGDTLKAKTIDVVSTNSIVRTRTVSGDKILYSFQLSGDAGSPGNNKMYGTNASGMRGWYDQPGGGGGGVSSVGLAIGSAGTDANVIGSPITSSGTFTLNIPTASATARGLLSASDWNSFSSRVPDSRTITINGTTYNLSANRVWNVGTVTSVGVNISTAGTDINVSGSPVSVSGNININIPTASAIARGALSSADWSSFNSRVPDSRTITINGVAQNLSANRSWTIAAPVRYDTVYYFDNSAGDAYYWQNGISALVVANAISNTQVNLPYYATNVGRVLTIRNASANGVTFNDALIYSTTYNDDDMMAGGWVTIQAKDNGWYVIAGGGSYNSSGNFYPTVNGPNTTPILTTVDAKNARYIRVGDQVFVSGQIDFTPSAAGMQTIALATPFNYTNTDEWQLTGTLSVLGGGGGAEIEPGKIVGKGGTGLATLTFRCFDTSAHKLQYNYSYTITFDHP